jgi:uncharacterized protein (DUF1501 family)
MTCCREHSRSAILRSGVAAAGRGLPAIERGMPLPAGTGLSRREFVAQSVGLALTVYGGSALAPDVLEHGIGAARAATAKQRILVSVFLDGGADSLTMLAPANDPRYRKLRPRLAVAPAAGTPFAEDDRLRWHPSLAPFATLHGEGKVTVLPGIGYANANQSHFTSRHYWEVGATDTRLVAGWLGRYLDRVGRLDNPLQGLSLGWSLAPSLATTKVPVAAVDAPDSYDFWSRGVWGEVEQRMIGSLGRLGALPTGGDAGLVQATAATRQSARLYEQLRPFRPKDDKDKGFGARVAYPESEDGFPRRLAGLAAMIAAGLPLRVVAITAPGAYDTHDGQAGELPGALKLTADSLLAFQRDLEARGLADRVLVHVWSEFGRRAAENGSGTDHGAGGAGFVIGTRARGTMVGEFPGLARLDRDGNLRHTSDFRAVYASLLEDWLGTDADGLLPPARGVQRVSVVR